MRIAEISRPPLHVTYDAERLGEMDPRLFEPRHLRKEGRLVGTDRSPRGAVWIFRSGSGTFVLRHYRHGGALGGLLRDRYLWCSLARTRPAREWRMLRALCSLALPVPEPAAWRVLRHGPLLYQADLITGLIPDCEPLRRFLSARALDEAGWRRLGATLRRFHDHQVWHPDLNAGNVLIDARGRFHLVDFDRARQRPGQHWKRSTLRRLRGSFEKQRERDPALPYRDADFRLLLDAYESGSR